MWRSRRLPPAWGRRAGRPSCKVLLPTLLPATLTGFTLAFARALGEYGSVIFISSNLPYKGEIVALLVVQKLETGWRSSTTGRRPPSPW